MEFVRVCFVMSAHLHLVLEGLLLIATAHAQFGGVGGRYELILPEMGHCDDVGTNEMRVDLQITNYNSSFSHIQGTVNLSLGWSDNFQVLNKVKLLGKDGTVKSNFLVKNFGGGCVCAKTMIPDLAKQIWAGMGNFKTCPIKPGNYTMDFDMSVKPVAGVPIAFYGKYRLEYHLISAKTKKQLGCFYLIAEFVPKKNSRRRG